MKNPKTAKGNLGFKPSNMTHKVSNSRKYQPPIRKAKLYQESETNFDDTDEFYGRNDDAEPIKGPISYASRGQQKLYEEEDPEYSHMLDNFPTKLAHNDASSDE